VMVVAPINWFLLMVNVRGECTFPLKYCRYSDFFRFGAWLRLNPAPLLVEMPPQPCCPPKLMPLIDTPLPALLFQTLVLVPLLLLLIRSKPPADNNSE